MIFTRIKNNLSDPAYYFSQILGILSISFLTILWLYLAQLGLIKLTTTQIVIYFLSIYAYFYLFSYDLINKLSARFSTQSQSFLISPQSIYLTLFVKDFLPLLLDSLPLISIVLFLSLALGVLPLAQLPFFILLELLVHLTYFFTSIIGAIFEHLLNWGYIAFSYRFIGQTWNGSYIPLIFLSGNFLSFALFLPIFYSGVPFQLLLNPSLDSRFLLNLFIFLAISFGLSYLLLRRFLTYVQE